MSISTAKLLDFSNEQIKDIQKLLSTDSRFSVNPTSSGLCVMIDNTELFTFRSIDETWSGSRFCHKFRKADPDLELPKEAEENFKSYVLNSDNTDLISNVMNDEEPLGIFKLKIRNSTMADNMYSVVTFHDYPASYNAYIDAALVCPNERTIIFLCVYRLRYNLSKYYSLLENNNATKLKEYTLKLFNLHRRIKNMAACNIPAEEFEIKIHTMVQLNGLNERQYDFIFKDYKKYLSYVPEDKRDEFGWCLCDDFLNVNISEEKFTSVSKADFCFKESIAERYNVKMNTFTVEDFKISSSNADMVKKRYFLINTEISGTNVENDRIISVSAILYENGKIVDKYTTLVNSSAVISEKISQMTNITNEMLASAPLEKEVVQKLADFINDATNGDVVAFVSENEFLQKLFNRYGYKGNIRYISFFEFLYEETRVIRFDDMLKYFDIPKPENLTLERETEIRGEVLRELLKLF